MRRHFYFARFVLFATGVVMLGTVWEGHPAASPIEPDRSIASHQSLQRFLVTYCIACHGPTKQSADLTFHDKKPDSLQNDRVTWDKAVERLEKSEMPPKGKPQPTADEKQAAIAWIKSETAKANCEKPIPPGRVTLRRLNRSEYNNTIRDLLALDFRPAEDFPSDDVGYGFDNIGDVLVMSPLLLEKYLAAAESIVQKAFTGELPPLPPKRVIRPREFKESAKAVPGPERTVVFSTGSVSATHDFPRDGEYVVLYRALGKQIDRDPVKMSLRIDDAESHKADLKPFAEGRTPPDREVTMTVKGGTHTLAFAIDNPKSSDEESEGKRRERAIVLGAVEIRGPLVPLVKIMPEAHRRIMIAQPGPDLSKADCAKRIVENFARRAYRRPPNANEVERLVRLVDLAESQGDSFERGIQLAVQAILISPHFLFKVGKRAVLAHHCVEKERRFLKHRVAQGIVKLGKEPSVGRRRLQVPDLQPLSGKIFAECANFGVRKHAANLRLEILAKLAAIRESRQFVVGARSPQKVRESRCQFVFGDRILARDITAVVLDFE
jgi:mono/diheme cytochrome c family protein